MSARFTKLQEVDLEDPVSEKSLRNESGIENVQETKQEGTVQLNLDLDSDKKDPLFVPKWKFWKRPYKYNITSTRKHFPPSAQKVCKKCKCKINSWRAVIITLLVFTAAVLISVVISRLVGEPPDDTQIPEPNGPKQAAVAADVPVCSEISAGILKQNGSAVDAAITALLCLGVVHAESSGLGGGGFMVVRHENGSVYAINFRETAPSQASENMFHSSSNLSRLSGLAVAVPGELKGMELAHNLFGRLSWRELFTPVIAMCRNGFNMTVHTEKAVKAKWPSISEHSQLRAIYANENGSLKKVGDLVVRPVLANTLEGIAEQGADLFYKGTVAKSIVRALQDSRVRGILTMEDLSNYTAVLEEPLHVNYKGYSMYAPPSPSGGPLLLFTLNVMDNYDILDTSDKTSGLNLTYHRLVEAFKYGFALRTQLGDPDCANCSDIADEILAVQMNMTSDDYAASVKSSISDNHTNNVSYYHAHYSGALDSGTTHVSILASDGQAVSVTSTVNGYFGSAVITDTGIVLNNEMDDFSSPNITNEYGLRPSSANYIRPGKRPLSSTCPTIVVKSAANESVPHLVIGGSGGSRIPTAVAQVVLRYLSLSESVDEAIEARRVHHQLLPNEVCPEVGFPDSILEFLASRGHVIHCDNSAGYAAVQGIARSGGNVTAHSDSRKLAHTASKD